MAIVSSVFTGGVQSPELGQLLESTFIKNVLPDRDYRELGIDLRTGINWKLELGTINSRRGLLKVDTGCSPTYTSTGSAIASRSIQVTKLQVRDEQCANAFYESMYEKALGKGINIKNLVGTELEAVVFAIIADNLRLDNLQLAFFGDTDSTVDVLSPFNGFFKLFEDELPAAQKLTIGSLSTVGNAIAAMRAVYDARTNYSASLRPDEMRFMITRSVWDKFVRDTTTNSSTYSNSLALERLFFDPMGNAYFAGIPIIVLPDWDVTIANLLTVSGVPTDPDRILLVSVNNLIVGTDVEGDDNRLFMTFDERTDSNLIKANYKLGVQFKYPEHIVYSR
jgi:hypothetical protein